MDGFRFQIIVEDERAAGFTVKTTFFSFLFPFFAIAVAVEADWFTLFNILTYYLNDCRNLRLALFNKGIYIFLKRTNCSATAVLSAIMALAQLASEPGARNSNRFPVNANGEVRLRSVLSISNSGI